jgi:hypothetical protein
MKHPLLITALFFGFIGLAGCSDQKKDSSAAAQATMKCGVGKCGATMLSGDSELAKTQRSFLSQMSRNDPRTGCVMNAKSVKALYDCVRDPKTGKLTLEYNATK